MSGSTRSTCDGQVIDHRPDADLAAVALHHAGCGPPAIRSGLHVGRAVVGSRLAIGRISACSALDVVAFGAAVDRVVSTVAENAVGAAAAVDPAGLVAPCAEALRAVRAACPGITISLSTSAAIEPDPERRLSRLAAWTELPDLVTVNQGDDGVVELCELLASRGIGIEAGLLSLEAPPHAATPAGRPGPAAKRREADFS